MEKVADKYNRIAHGGPKKEYGPVLPPKIPADVYQLISDLCNTKVVFHIEGSALWLGSNLGLSLAKKVRKLSKGECIVSLRAGNSTPPVQIRVPNVSDSR